MKKELEFLGKAFEELNRRDFVEIYTQHQYDRVWKTVFCDGHRLAEVFYDNNDKVKRFIVI